MANVKLNLGCLLFVVVVAFAAISHAQTPQPDAIKRIAQCLGAENLQYQVDILVKTEQTYKAQGTEGFKSANNFLDKFPPEQRLEAYKAYVRCIRKEAESHSRVPPNLLEIVGLGSPGTTSIDYLVGVLGIPKSSGPTSAEFLVDGYQIVATYLDKGDSGRNKGTVVRLMAQIRYPEQTRATPMIVDSEYWNPVFCFIDEAGKEKCAKTRIAPLSLGEGHTLSKYLGEDSSCERYSKAISPKDAFGNSVLGYFASCSGARENGFVRLYFRVDLNEYKHSEVVSALMLYENLVDPKNHPIDESLRQHLESRVGEVEKYELYDLVSKGFASSRVVGVAISSMCCDLEDKDYYNWRR